MSTAHNNSHNSLKSMVHRLKTGNFRNMQHKEMDPQREAEMRHSLQKASDMVHDCVRQFHASLIKANQRYEEERSRHEAAEHVEETPPQEVELLPNLNSTTVDSALW